MGIRQDEFQFTLVNFSRLIHTSNKLKHDPYMFSSQVEQVVYVQDPKNENWSKVVKANLGICFIWVFKQLEKMLAMALYL